MRDKSIDLNTLLMGANLLVVSLIVFGSSLTEGNEYVDRETVVLGVLLCIQTQIVLSLERRQRDPFALLLAFEMIFFYALRIFTLTLYPYSRVFWRYEYDAHDSNYGLIFILIANLFLYLGFYSVRSKSDRVIDSAGWRATSPARVVALMSAAIIFAYFTGNWTEDEVPRVFIFLRVFVQQNIILLMALVYYFLLRKSLSRKVALAIALLLIADVVMHTLFGSRSGIFEFVQSLIFVMLAIAGYIKLSRKLVVLGLILSPVIIALLVGSFVISTFNRGNKDVGVRFDLGRAVQLAGESGSELLAGPALDVVLAPIFERVGFFDYSAEIIAHREKYSTLINVPVYFMSIVDNVLTPGFDVYDQPKIANGLQFIYQDWGGASKEELERETYHSDQLGVYGEFYALFGYACLPLLFIVARLLKTIYVRLSGKNPFVLAMKRVIVLFIFSEVLRSFGIDWIIAEVLPFVAAIFIYAFFFAIKPLSESEGAPYPKLHR